MGDLDNLKSRRKGLRAVITRYVNEINTNIADNSTDYSFLVDMSESTQENLTELSGIHDQIVKLLATKAEVEKSF